jgi:hypothetical protein
MFLMITLRPKSRLKKHIMLGILCILFGIMFIYFAYLNINDIDPWIWVPIYLAAAVVCILAYFKISNAYADALLVLFYIIYSIRNWPAKWEGVTMPMSHSINVERGRESLGLLICAACTAFSYYAAQ